MVYRGQVCGDVIVLSNGVRLPDGSEVLVEPIVVKASAPPVQAMNLRNGVPVFATNVRGTAPNLELVNELRDDAP